MSDLLTFLLRERPEGPHDGELAAWWQHTSDVRGRFSQPVERAIASGFVSDRLGFAFAAGYEAAIHALVPSLPGEAIASFCVTEEGGNHPRAIRTRLERGAGGFTISGAKKWSTMAPVADVLVVVVTEGDGPDERPRLRAVVVDKSAPGVVVRAMPPTPFVPEVPHAELELARVPVSAAGVLPGDGYTDYTKAFRTVEDLHVTAATAGYGLSVALRHRFPASVRERYAALVSSMCHVATLDPRRPEAHVALAGVLGEAASIQGEADASWAVVADSERDRWYRDRLLVQVASKARELRRERAWQTLIGEGKS